MKTIDTKSYLSVLCELAEKGNRVSTVVTGGSMVPFLASNRDYVCLEKPKSKLRKGDVVLFKRQNGDFVLHRIRYIRGCEYYLVGDRQTETEGPVKREQILAIATGARRKGKWISQKSLVWNFYSRVWLYTVRLRPVIFKFAGSFRRKRKAETR